MNDKKKNIVKEIEDRIKYKFKDKSLLIRALTHSSYSNEQKSAKIKNNERIEFLGDSVLGLIVSDYIFKKYTNHPEGDLTRFRAIVVCENTLSSAARNIRLGEYLFLGRGEEGTGGRKRNSILADAFEAIIGAIYLDGGFDASRNFVLYNLSPFIEQAAEGRLFLDYKTQLQEIIQQESHSNIVYRVVKEEGPDHNKIFFVEVNNNEHILGAGKGKSKKEAEQNAAKAALIGLGDVNV